MSTKHTPATLSAMPLRAEQRYQSAEHRATKDAVILDSQGAWIATVGDKPTAAHLAHAANAYPKLVEQLRRAVMTIQQYHGMGNIGGNEAHHATLDARALLRDLGEIE